MASAGRKEKGKGIGARLAAAAGGGAEAPTMKRTEESDKEIEKILHSTSAHVQSKLKKVADAFAVFDAANKNVIDVREVGCLVRALGLCVNEEELHEIVVMVEDMEAPGSVKYDRFVPYVAMLLLEENRFPAPSDDDLRMSFKVLDIERMGYFDYTRIRDIMMKEGEPFNGDEFDDMMRFGLDPDDQKFYWHKYLEKAGIKDPEVQQKKRDKRKLEMAASRGK